MWRVSALIATAVILWSECIALANGRFPATVDVRFQPGDTSVLVTPATFGLLLSSDGGETFHWVCEDAIGYGGTYDPDYAVANNGFIYATTFAGLRVSQDQGCTWQNVAGPFDGTWVGEVEIATDQTIWATTSTGNAPNDVYRSISGGPFQSVGLSHDEAWWLSVQPAPSMPDLVYVSGFIPAPSNTPSTSLLRKSTNAGQTWATLSVDDFELGQDSQILIEAVSGVDPNVVFARVLRARSPVGDDLYRSLDGGQSWEKILEMPDTIGAFVVRADGNTLLAGTDTPCEGDPPEVPKGCVMTATGGGLPGVLTWFLAAEQPRAACLAEREDGTLFACGANWEPDQFGLGRSQNGETWSQVMRFTDIVGPLECPEATEQFQTCARLKWSSLCEQLSICGDEPEPEPKGSGGCSTGAGGLGLLGILLLVWLRVRRD